MKKTITDKLRDLQYQVDVLKVENTKLWKAIFLLKKVPAPNRETYSGIVSYARRRV